MKSWKRRIQILLTMLVTSYLAICVYFWATQDHKIFAPMEEIAETPDDLEPPLPYDWVEIQIKKGNKKSKVHGFWVPVNDTDAPTVLYLHGQDATIGKNLGHTECLHQLGCNVLVIDYRGFGRSFGTMTPTEASLYEDAEAAWKYLTVTRGFEPDRVLLYGHSLGGAVAIELATRHPEAGGLIVESAFTSIRNMARWKYPVTYLVPLDLLLNHHFESLEKIRNKTIPPVLFIHGIDDSKIPCFMCEQLHGAAPGLDKNLLLIKGGKHADRGPIGLVAYKAKVAAFIRNCLKP
jgi:fermentation-respiration switch protein FrsA (DUF1100 family)